MWHGTDLKVKYCRGLLYGNIIHHRHATEYPTQPFSLSFFNFYSTSKSCMMLSADPSFRNTELHPLPFVQELQ